MNGGFPFLAPLLLVAVSCAELSASQALVSHLLSTGSRSDAREGGQQLAFILVTV